MKKVFLFFVAFNLILLNACDDTFLEVSPQGTLAGAESLATIEGIDALLIGAYSVLDGWNGIGEGAWRSPASNWTYGNVPSDDGYKGSDQGDQTPLNDIERFTAIASNPYFLTKWKVVYDGVRRSNDALRAIASAREAGSIGDSDIETVNIREAEARFLRGHYHFEAKKMWNNVPYVDEIPLEIDEFKITNTVDIWPNIEEDLRFATVNLPESQPDVGRITSWTAKGLLAKAHMFQQDFNAAKEVLDDIISNGPFDLLPNYGDNFNATFNNSVEDVFEVQTSVNDGVTNSGNGNWGDVINFPHDGSPFGCCGFNQPSYNLVNAYQTDPLSGLPLLDTFNDNMVTNDQGIDSTEPFTEHQGTLDPRLDHSVGRRGIPYLDWGDHGGRVWIRDQGFSGPYSPKKNVYRKSDVGTLTSNSGWTTNANAINIPLIRFADVILWRAEVAVEENDFETARQLVNMIRVRARDGAYVSEPDGSPAANYLINEYPAGHPAFSSLIEARKAVRFERRLELGMEGHRFPDLVRYGIAEETLNAYFAIEGTRPGRTFLAGATFETGKHEYFPIPFQEIQASVIDGQSTLTQNPGY